MTIGIVGLGLIGGSLAKAIKCNTDHQVLGCDLSDTVMKKARLLNAVDGDLTDETLGECELVIVALYPQQTIDYVNKKLPLFRKGAVITDTCGVQGVVCRALFPAAKEQGITFIGGHPMAGTQFSGFAHARATLFSSASMILVPPPDVEIQLLEKLKELFLTLGFSELKITTPEEHDQLIAYTSQLAHVVSNAYVKSPSALRHRGFSAGSYRDLTRVAWLNEEMWTELFLDNADYLADEIDGLVHRLSEYSAAIRSADAEGLKTLLHDGKERKAAIDGGEDLE